MDENLLSILKWRLTLTGPSNRWYPVLLRYIDVLSGRIRGMGGDPSQTPPSQTGFQPHVPPHMHEPREHCYTGKVSSVFFDRFGDFEAFDLRTEKGEEHSFRAFEHEIEELIYAAWLERFVITVCVQPIEHRPVTTVILRRAPKALRRQDLGFQSLRSTARACAINLQTSRPPDQPVFINRKLAEQALAQLRNLTRRFEWQRAFVQSKAKDVAIQLSLCARRGRDREVRLPQKANYRE